MGVTKLAELGRESPAQAIRPAPELALRSLDATWDRARWEGLPVDGRRYEVIDGVLYMTTAPSSFHQWIIQQIFLALHQQVVVPGAGLVFLAPIGLFMPGCDPVQPDLLAVRAADRAMIRDRHIYGVPALLVEVLSPSTARQDLEIKRAAYARAGVPEYWIARAGARDVLVHSEPEPTTGLYTRVTRFALEDELVSPTLPIRIPVADLFTGAPDTTI